MQRIAARILTHTESILKYYVDLETQSI